MTATIEQAREDVFSIFNTRLQAEASTILGSPPEVYYQGRPVPKDRPKDRSYIIASIKHSPESSKPISGDGAVTRIENVAMFTAGIFVPLNEPNRVIKALNLGSALRAGYAGKSTSNGVWFRNTAVVEEGDVEYWYHVNLIVEFEYDTLL